MEKEEFSKEISGQLSELRSHAEKLTKLCDQLSAIARGGDAAITAMKDAKTVHEEMKGAKEAIEKVRKAMKARAIQVIKEV